jgi:hypothetical protein
MRERRVNGVYDASLQAQVARPCSLLTEGHILQIAISLCFCGNKSNRHHAYNVKVIDGDDDFRAHIYEKR